MAGFPPWCTSWLTTHHRIALAATLSVKPPAMVPSHTKEKDDRSLHLSPQNIDASRLQYDRFGDNISIKPKRTLQIGFQNIGGFPTHRSDIKEDYIRLGLSNWDFDVFGLAETNLDWRMLPEENKLWYRMREWWELT